jgi:hypothetical protein
MTLMRRVWHLIVWVFYLDGVLPSIRSQLLIPFSFDRNLSAYWLLWGNFLILWPSLYFPVKIPALPTEERKLKASLQGKQIYLVFY